jgi:hypothetical protein
MKRNLFFAALVFFTSCNEQSQKQQIDLPSEKDNAPSLIIERELDACDKIIAKYQTLIDKTLAGDFESMKKLPVIKVQVEKELQELNKLSAYFDAKQLEKFSASREKFLKVDSRIK